MRWILRFGDFGIYSQLVMLDRKYLIYFLILLITLLSCVHHPPVGSSIYQGNGTLISEEETDGLVTRIRQHKQTIEILDDGNPRSFSAHQSPDIESAALYNFATGETIQAQEYLFRSSEDNLFEPESWLSVLTPLGEKGWIKLDNAADLYPADTWSILPWSRTKYPGWTIRSLKSSVLVDSGTTVYQSPRREESHIAFRSEAGSMDYIAITEKRQTLEGVQDRWLLVPTENGELGWIFGGDISLGRGGPKYPIPTDILFWYFNPL
jgi:hypothetical protein